ncbi:hypothetical protein DES53_12410 [Roseimicrobium gellanilyticum]|uniref:Uncharacterized protein n=1 Tax=Roseimicrobium gellanilyticum TaxID=748857 RepID=A0A366H132_9BACT|nr:hypothetical protein [Roseimicrobium gellanilyticum]RBP35210.1 hypothetical protein DES53_12410 [Roseimicrobium gellanilyticum]
MIQFSTPRIRPGGMPDGSRWWRPVIRPGTTGSTRIIAYRPGGTAEGVAILGATALHDHGTPSGVASGTPSNHTQDPVVAVAEAPCTTGYHPASLRDELRICSSPVIDLLTVAP